MIFLIMIFLRLYGIIMAQPPPISENKVLKMELNKTFLYLLNFLVIRGVAVPRFVDVVIIHSDKKKYMY